MQIQSADKHHAMPERAYIEDAVGRTLREDVGTGDLTAALVPDHAVQAKLITRDNAVICGVDFFNEVFRQLEPSVNIDWNIRDGDSAAANTVLCIVTGPARAVLTGERTALNWLQTLSGTATLTRRYVEQVRHTGARILDTRKTIPGLRAAQKYAVRCGGGHNHRMGLYDAILIKENHLRAGHGLESAIRDALLMLHDRDRVEVEVVDLAELDRALTARAPRILLDNFSLTDLHTAVRRANGRAQLEASGGINLDNVREIAETGVDFISIGALTKDLRAVDLSFQFTGAS
jgi:nicotinate-nucleotide pyrophosphorylase (carboxylating)